MANPDPRLNDPVAAPLTGNPAIDTANRGAANSTDPKYADRTVVSSRRNGSGVMIAAIILVLAVAAYFLFMPRTATNTTTPAATTGQSTTGTSGSSTTGTTTTGSGSTGGAMNSTGSGSTTGTSGTSRHGCARHQRSGFDCAGPVSDSTVR